MSWSPFFSHVEIEGDTSSNRNINTDPYSWYPGVEVSSFAGAGRFEINGDDFSSGEEINDLDYRALVMKEAIKLSRSNNRSTPNTLDMAKAQRLVDNALRKKDITRAYKF